MHQHPIRKFFGNMFSEWGSGLSGPTSVPLAIFALFASNAALKFAFGAMAIVLGFVSAYRIWHREYLRAEAEIDKHKRPDIRGEAIIAFWDSPTDPNTGYRYRSRYYVKLRLVNHADVACTISEYRMLSVALDGKETISMPGVDFISGVIRHKTNFADELTSVGPDGSQTNPMSIPVISSQWPLVRACERKVWVQFDIADHIPDFRDDGPDCVQEIFTVVITDSLGGKHEIDGVFTSVCKGKLQISPN